MQWSSHTLVDGSIPRSILAAPTGTGELLLKRTKEKEKKEGHGIGMGSVGMGKMREELG